MPVLINFKICDNAEECGGIATCRTGALTWDSKKKSIKIDNDKCISCGLCERSCEVGAIKVAKSENEYKKLKAETDKDPRQIADLYVDRYGAQPVLPMFLLGEKDFHQVVEMYPRISVVEIFNGNSINCLLRSIPIKDLLKDKQFKYSKVNDMNGVFEKRFELHDLPALLFFDNGKLIGKIEGYFENKDKDNLTAKINKILEDHE